MSLLGAGQSPVSRTERSAREALRGQRGAAVPSAFTVVVEAAHRAGSVRFAQSEVLLRLQDAQFAEPITARLARDIASGLQRERLVEPRPALPGSRTERASSGYARSFNVMPERDLTASTGFNGVDTSADRPLAIAEPEQASSRLRPERGGIASGAGARSVRSRHAQHCATLAPRRSPVAAPVGCLLGGEWHGLRGHSSGSSSASLAASSTSMSN